MSDAMTTTVPEAAPDTPESKARAAIDAFLAIGSGDWSVLAEELCKAGPFGKREDRLAWHQRTMGWHPPSTEADVDEVQRRRVQNDRRDGILVSVLVDQAVTDAAVAIMVAEAPAGAVSDALVSAWLDHDGGDLPGWVDLEGIAGPMGDRDLISAYKRLRGAIVGAGEVTVPEALAEAGDALARYRSMLGGVPDAVIEALDAAMLATPVEDLVGYVADRACEAIGERGPIGLEGDDVERMHLLAPAGRTAVVAQEAPETARMGEDSRDTVRGPETGSEGAQGWGRTGDGWDWRTRAAASDVAEGPVWGDVPSWVDIDAVVPADLRARLAVAYDQVRRVLDEARHPLTGARWALDELGSVLAATPGTSWGDSYGALFAAAGGQRLLDLVMVLEAWAADTQPGGAAGAACLTGDPVDGVMARHGL